MMEMNPDQVPMARPRASSEKLALISARLPRTSKAPPDVDVPLHGAARDVQRLGDLLVVQSFHDETQDVEFARAEDTLSRG
jgi:hypothetical protein